MAAPSGRNGDNDLISYECLDKVFEMEANTSAFLLLLQQVHSYPLPKLCFL